MPDLKSYIDSLPANEKFVISEPVDLDFSLTSLVLELEAQKRFPVVVIERSKGFDVPAVTNLFADRDRIAHMVGAKPGGFGQAWAHALGNLTPAVMTDHAPVHEVVALGNEVDAGQLPISRHFAADAGRYIGSGILICKDPDTGVRNLSFQRMQLKGPNRFGASLHSRGHIWDHLLRCEARSRNMEVAVVIGCHPAIYIAAAAKVAMEIDELEVAGALMREPVKLVKCKTIDMEVPADAEYVIEGEILAGAHEDEGPYGEYTGYSTYRSTRNVFVVKAITHKRRPIFLDIIPGYSAEHLLLSRCTREAHVTHRLREMVPTLKAVSYPKTGVHFHAYVSLKKTAEGQARQALMLLMGLDSYIKLAVAVDDDIDVFNEDEVLWALATRFQADTDMFIVPKVFCNRLDPSSVDGMSAKVGIDATKAPNFEGERTRQTAESVAWARSVISRQLR
jgi:2,5-furandicarboxylate decarboxylase 1